MGLYKPPTKVTTVQVPWLAMVHKADPDFERRKHREPEYAPWWSGQGRPFFADPYKLGAYNTPSKTVTVNYSGPQVLNAGDITGVGYDFVTLISESSTPGSFTTRTAAQMFADIPGAVPNIGHALRIVNNAIGSDLTLLPSTGVLLKDRGGWLIKSIVVRSGTYADLRVQFPDAADAVISVDALGAPYSALVG